MKKQIKELKENIKDFFKSKHNSVEEIKENLCNCHCEAHNGLCRYRRFRVLRFFITLIILLIVFQAGKFVGYHKAMFYKHSGENYYRTMNIRGGQTNPFDNQDQVQQSAFNGQGQFNNFMQDSNIPGGNGAVGKIVSINLPTIVVASPDNVEKTVNISNDTLIREFRDTIGAKDLKIGEYVIILGTFSDQDNGLIEARLIRIIPPPPADIQRPDASVSTSTNQK